MIYLPGSCERCPNLTLISSEDCIGGKSLCSACGGLVSILPGCAYPEGDVTLFEALSAVVNACELSTADAWKLTDRIQQSRFDATEAALLALLTDCLPLLEPYRPILEANPARLRQALSMLDAIFRARAATRSASAIYRTAAFASAEPEVPDGEEPKELALGVHTGFTPRK